MSREGDRIREKILCSLHPVSDVGTLTQMARDIATLGHILLPEDQRWFLAERLRDVSDQLEKCDRLWR